MVLDSGMNYRCFFVLKSDNLNQRITIHILCIFARFIIRSNE